MTKEKKSKAVSPGQGWQLNKKSLLSIQMVLLAIFLLFGWAFYPQECENIDVFELRVSSEEMEQVSANITTIENILEDRGFSAKLEFDPHMEQNTTGGRFELLFRTGYEHYLTLYLEGEVNETGNFTELLFSGEITNYDVSLFPGVDPRIENSFTTIKDTMEEEVDGISKTLNLSGKFPNEYWEDSDTDSMNGCFAWCSFCFLQVCLGGGVLSKLELGKGSKVFYQPPPNT